MIRILGVDPGLAETGYGIIDIKDNKYNHILHGSISTPSDYNPGKRLQIIYKKLSEIIKKYKPNEAGVESLYFAKNVTSAIPVAQARGIVLLCLENHGVITFEYPPQEIKRAIVGHGRADKEQVQKLVLFLLSMKNEKIIGHASDALASAICHFHNRSMAAFRG